LPNGFEESLIYQLYETAKEMQMVQMLLFSLFCHVPKSFTKEQIEEMEEDSLQHFVNKGQCASADWRGEIQACFGRLF